MQNDSSTNNCLIDKSAGILLLGCKATTTIPEGVVLIADHAFRNCALTSIHIPSTVSDIGAESFYDCQKTLTSITVHSNNSIYSSDRRAGSNVTEKGRNCIVKIDSKTLIMGCKTTIIPPEGYVTTIGSYAFRNCTGILGMVIPAAITTVQENAFAGCSNFEKIYHYNTSGDPVRGQGTNTEYERARSNRVLYFGSQLANYWHYSNNDKSSGNTISIYTAFSSFSVNLFN